MAPSAVPTIGMTDMNQHTDTYIIYRRHDLQSIASVLTDTEGDALAARVREDGAPSIERWCDEHGVALDDIGTRRATTDKAVHRQVGRWLDRASATDAELVHLAKAWGMAPDATDLPANLLCAAERLVLRLESERQGEGYAVDVAECAAIMQRRERWWAEYQGLHDEPSDIGLALSEPVGAADIDTLALHVIESVKGEGDVTLDPSPEAIDAWASFVPGPGEHVDTEELADHMVSILCDPDLHGDAAGGPVELEDEAARRVAARVAGWIDRVRDAHDAHERDVAA